MRSQKETEKADLNFKFNSVKLRLSKMSKQ